MSGLDVYEQTNITTQSKGRLIVLLYEGAIRFLRYAIQAIEKSDYQSKSCYITKAQDILFELNTVLDMESGTQISQNLRQLYNFMQKHLTDANVKSEPQMIREVIGLLEELNQGWKAVAV